MKNFLYKLIFPESGKLYVGKAKNENRYGNNRPGDRFVGPHHNPEVQNLLDSGEFCFFHVIREFASGEEVELAEDSYLKKVWVSNDWETRPSWLMNRSRNSVGGDVWFLLSEDQKKKFQQSGADSKGGRNNKGNKRPDVSKRMVGNTLGSKTKGRKRPEQSELMKGNTLGSAHKGRKNPWNQKMNSIPAECPHCGKTLGNKGALGTHLKSCSKRV